MLSGGMSSYFTAFDSMLNTCISYRSVTYSSSHKYCTLSSDVSEKACFLKTTMLHGGTYTTTVLKSTIHKKNLFNKPRA